jgi:tRNA 2-(methylsulfanyl)-N6-isopentenyladenosine37 hydroxylase
MSSILAAATPPEWVDLAADRWRELLVDHANCEKKAASTALALMFAYPEDGELARQLSRLARQELRHFELVERLMRQLEVAYVRQKPGRYAAGLRAALRQHEPQRKLDLLLCGALIESRSRERFLRLAGRLPAAVDTLYASLVASEARHEGLYLRLAEKHAAVIGDDAWRDRLAELAAVEAGLATSPDAQFRFHSGAPAGQPGA